jgi:hypothetical protein
MKLIIVALLAMAVAGCASRNQAAARAQDRQTIEQELGQEMSLKADRESLSDLRKEIPEETQRSNDELALFLNLMRQGNETPQMVRDKFNVMVQKKRASFRDKVAKLRENYRRDETKRRETRLDEAKAKRDSFLRRKHDPKESREFFNDQEKSRLAFTADERARRTAFESEITAQSKDFDSYMRERQKEFDEQYRLYSKKFSERPKDKKAATGDEFRRLEQAPSTPLGTED